MRREETKLGTGKFVIIAGKKWHKKGSGSRVSLSKKEEPWNY